MNSTQNQSNRKRPRPDFTDRGPPHDMDAEKAVLGLPILDHSLIGWLSKNLTEADLYDERHRVLWRSMLRLHKRGLPPDITLLVGDLRDHGQYGDLHFHVNAYVLVSLYRLYPCASLADHYLARVKEMSRRRHALERGEQLIRAAYGQQDNTTSKTAHRRAGKVIA